MKPSILLSALLALTPVAALAMPQVGDVVGNNPDDAKAALEKAGCTVNAFEAEGGKIEAKCTDTATNKKMEVYLDPKTGAVTDIKDYD